MLLRSKRLLEEQRYRVTRYIHADFIDFLSVRAYVFCVRACMRVCLLTRVRPCTLRGSRAIRMCTFTTRRWRISREKERVTRSLDSVSLSRVESSTRDELRDSRPTFPRGGG